MANRDMGRKSQNPWRDRDSMDADDRDRVRGRVDEMEDAWSDTEEFDDIEDLDEEEDDDGDRSS